MKIRRKGGLFLRLYVYFAIAIVLPLLALGVFTYYQSAGKLEQQAQDNLTQVVRNATHHTELFIRNYENSTLSLLSNSDIKHLLDLNSPYEYEYYRYTREIKEAAFEPVLIRHPEIQSIYVIGDTLAIGGERKSVFSYGNLAGVPPTDPEAEKFIGALLENTDQDGRLTIINGSLNSPRSSQMLTLARRVRGLGSLDYKGVLAVEVQSTELSTLWQGIDLGESGYFHIVDQAGKTVYHSDPASASVPPEKEIRIERYSAYTGWHLIVAVQEEQLRRPIVNIRTNVLLAGCITLAAALGLAYRFSRSVTNPLYMLRKGMEQTQKGEWTLIPVAEVKDEVDELMISYNSMVHRLSELIDQVYESELRHQQDQNERQQAEFQALQLQINPHFLYNTLETIACYAAVQDSDEIMDIVKSMSYMLRYSVQTSLAEITVANELKHVLHYMTVMNYRLGREFEIEVAIPPRYLLKHMVRLTLQPLIENIFQHAFPQGITAQHTIQIDAWEEADWFVVSVEDNGAGMSSARLEELKNKLKENRLAEMEDSGGGIGMLNVHRRIQMVYGEQYGLRITSESENGAQIHLLMPRT